MYTNNTRASNNVTINTNISSLELLANTVTDYAEGIIQRDNKRKVEHLKNVPIGSKSRRRRTGLNMYDALRSNLTREEILRSYDDIIKIAENRLKARIIQRDNKRKVEHLKNVPIGSKSRRRRTGLNMYDALRSNLTREEILRSYDDIDNYLKNKVPASDIVQTFEHISPKAKRVAKQTKVFNVKPTNTPRQGGNFDYDTITQEEAHQNCLTVDQLPS